MRAIVTICGLGLVLASCGDSPAIEDAGVDSSIPDAGGSFDGGASGDDAGADAASPRADAGEDASAAPTDAGPTDAGSTDAGSTDAGATEDGGAGPDGGGADAGGAACSTDADCAAGAEWCEGGRCVACDNSGLACRIACPSGWSVYTRNGCHPCACAPVNECTADADCVSSTGRTQRCYAGAFCWDWCPAGDPSCCYGNVCSNAGCSPPPPVGCSVRGCPAGQECRTDMGCASSACACVGGGSWACTDDCAGGVCVTP